MLTAQGTLDVTRCIRRTAAWANSSRVQPVVSRQRLEKIHSRSEEVWHFLCRLVIRIASWLESRDAGPVFIPLVVPEALRAVDVTCPIGLHIGQQILAAGRFQYGGDVMISPGSITVRGVGAVAVIRLLTHGLA